MYDVIIIGKGPAGISASLYTARANLKTLVIGKNDSSLLKAGRIENYFGFSDPVTGKFLLEEGEKQALRFGVEIVEDEVISVEKKDNFVAVTTTRLFEGKTVLLATGQSQKKLRIENLGNFEGKGVGYCTTCDGFFYNNLKVGVIGFKDYAVHEALDLEAYTKDITIYTNGMEPVLSEKYRDYAKKFRMVGKAITRLEGDEFLKSIHFSDGSFEEIDGLFIAYESASSVDFARQMGVLVENNAVIVDKMQKTNLDGLFAAGDCTGGLRQVSTAVGQGAVAGKKIVEHVRA